MPMAMHTGLRAMVCAQLLAAPLLVLAYPNGMFPTPPLGWCAPAGPRPPAQLLGSRRIANKKIY